jgi:hypothetical protein
MTDQAAVIDEMIGAHQIRSALARYCRGVDRRDSELLRTIYHPDAVDDHGWGLSASGFEFAESVNNPEILGYPCEITQHHITSTYIDIRGERAVSEAYFQSLQRVTDADGGLWDVFCGGRYADQWDRRSGEFKITKRSVIYDWVRTDEVKTMWPGPDHSVPKMLPDTPEIPGESTIWGEPSTTDPSYALLEIASPVARASS